MNLTKVKEHHIQQISHFLYHASNSQGSDREDFYFKPICAWSRASNWPRLMKHFNQKWLVQTNIYFLNVPVFFYILFLRRRVKVIISAAGDRIACMQIFSCGHNYQDNSLNDTFSGLGSPKQTDKVVISGFLH